MVIAPDMEKSLRECFDAGMIPAEAALVTGVAEGTARARFAEWGYRPMTKRESGQRSSRPPKYTGPDWIGTRISD